MELINETDDFKFACPSSLIIEKSGRVYRNISKVTYHSSTAGMDRTCNVCLPTGYTEDKKYPVLYVLHGFFGNEDTMLTSEDSKIPEILGNMYDDGEAKEAIVVFPNIYVSSDSSLAPGFSLESILPYDRFIDEIINDIVPYIEENYSTLTGAMNRAIIGFSMGGREAIYIAVKRSDMFGYIVAAAPAPGVIYAKDWAMEHPGMLAREELRIEQSSHPLEFFMLCCGAKDSTVGRFPAEYHAVMEENGVDHIWYEVPGMEHGKDIVQSAVYNLMKHWK